MDYMDKQVKVAKEAYEIMMLLEKLVVESKLAMVDGFQMTDVVMIATKIVPDLIVAMQGMDKIMPEMKEDIGASLAAGAIGGMDIIKAIMKK